MLAVAEHDAVARVRERSARADPVERHARFCRQGRYLDLGARRFPGGPRKRREQKRRADENADGAPN